MAKNSTIWIVSGVVIVGVIIFFFIILMVGALSMRSSKNSYSSSPAKSAQSTIGVGQALSTRYFDVTINTVETYKSVDLGNIYMNLKEEPETNYLVLNITFKNTDNESRMIIDGEVLINYNGKDYKFDKSETVLADGWGLFLDQINPLSSKTTNLVYKIPKEITGKAYYHPGRAGKKDLIYLGSL